MVSHCLTIEVNKRMPDHTNRLFMPMAEITKLFEAKS